MSADKDTTLSKVDVRWLEGNRFVGSDDEGHSVVFDSLSEAPSGNARARGIGPMKTLLASLGACSGMDVAAILLKRKQKLSSLAVEVSGRRPRYGHPKPFTEIHLRYLVGGASLEERYVNEAVADAVTKFCSVAATLNERAKVSFSYEIAQS